METPEALQRRISTAEELHSIVRTMKTLSSTTIRQYERAVSSMEHYVDTVELGFRVLLREDAIPLRSSSRRVGQPIGVIIFGTDRGFCGPFNREIARYAVGQLGRLEQEDDRRLLCMGTRLTGELARQGQVPDVVSRMPSSVEGIVGSVQELLLELDDWQAAGIDRVLIFHQRPVEAHGHEPRGMQLIPLDAAWLRSLADQPWPTDEIPMSYLEPRELLTALTRELVFASLYRAHAESLASEHAARLASMQAAEQTIEDRLGELEQRYHQVRQAAITEELLDVTSGFEAMSQAEQ